MTTKKRLEAARRQKQKQVTSLALMGVGILVLITLIAAFSMKGQPGKNSAGPSPDGSGTARLMVNREKIDLGNVKLGKEVSVSFTITNDGDSPLNLTKEPYIEVAAGCWPPVPTIGSMVLQPGESTQLSMRFLMHGNMGGMHDFRVHVPTNDPANPDKILTVLSNWVE